ncbi:hypothetical protein V7x_43280 [Crateriforma conspicua]|uniref:Uncharacterized protein n=1 Tax=Crateriforma conspicua TaxID=2527996 RepID=A0A5C6FQ64_9PLAN|nr:hypothetical protein V7x_43280 [Crateriforma conspicua]
MSKPPIAAVALVVVLAIVRASVGQDDSESKIDFDRARRLIERVRSGETLTPEEQTYVKQGRELRRKGQSRRTEHEITVEWSVQNRLDSVDRLRGRSHLQGRGWRSVRQPKQ